jgi:hypothetical protein
MKNIYKVGIARFLFTPLYYTISLSKETDSSSLSPLITSKREVLKLPLYFYPAVYFGANK